MGCNKCFRKLTDEKGYCDKCQEVVSRERYYFFRAKFEDCTGALEVAIGRDPAQDLMQLSAAKFHELGDKTQYLKENVLFREVKLMTKMKEEMFKGEQTKRYYVQSAEFVEDTTADNKDLLGKLDEMKKDK